jgi:hypothetical protein
VQFLADRITKGNTGCACNTHGRCENAYKHLVGKSVGKRLLGRARRIDGMIIIKLILMKLGAE